MKAKHFKRIKSKMKPFLILRSYGLFGDFSDHHQWIRPFTDFEEIMARNTQEAVQRYAKRTNTIKDFSSIYEKPLESNKTFGKWKVVPKDNPYPRFISYWT